MLKNVWTLAFLVIYDHVLTADGTFFKKSHHDDDDFERNVRETGRAFVTMLGYPSMCRWSTDSYPCTLTFACWLSGGRSETGCGGSSWLVACCVRSRRKPIHLTTMDEATTGDDEGDSNYIADDGLHTLQKRIDDDVDDDYCGLSSDRLLAKRIIGGKEAKFGQFPWQAHIKIGSYQCGGVLVARRYVATAAHCIIRARLAEIAVYLGELDTQDTGKVVELEPAELHRVKRRLVHPNFKYRLTQPDRYDLALLELMTDAAFSYHILPICLPQRGTDLTGKHGVVAGWGKIKPSTEPMGTNVLRSATVPLLTIEECISWHETKRIRVDLYEEMLCAGHRDGHQDACLGDSGGPLISLADGGRWTLIGITSAGFGCGEPFQPGIYHSVRTTADWIRSVIDSGRSRNEI